MKIGIYGLGRFGSFWASTLSRVADVQAYSRSSSAPEGVLFVSEENVCKSDLLFLCNSISSVGEVCDRIAPFLKEGMIVADTCSVKVHPLETMKKRLPASVQILGTHPMFGPDSGRNGVAGLPVALCPERIDDGSLKTVLDLFTSLGLRIETLTAKDHDREAAYSQGITHFIGRTLDLLNLEPSRISTTGYEDLLDIVQQTCNDKWQLFVDLQKFNPYTEEMRKKLHSSIEEMLVKLDSIESIGEK
ncbi:prephenate dehydrogenase/arogenate dehydrogenase family protein [Spirochaeta isovalerica]|uniref:Prephenate dehydrogenase n=1 Tax=Spirochaeta isovalerica TaxID=150 RepID=A0A841RBL1_9SPIO|nr:prephenate dehydrogenase/arogenate dehydrogenase family protein [Spirochaeta isovalerica]MBB6480627.1 prephenate dehydrogenase [Spirochaeta isovalerica]